MFVPAPAYAHLYRKDNAEDEAGLDDADDDVSTFRACWPDPACALENQARALTRYIVERALERLHNA